MPDGESGRSSITIWAGSKYIVCMATIFHFFISLLFLPLIALLVAGYAYIFKAVLRYALQLFRGLKKRAFSRDTFMPGREVWYVRSSHLKKLFLVCLLWTAGLYIYERPRWVKEQSAYLPAKQYMVVGAVILDYRTFGAAFIHPERLVCKPMVWLQQIVSRTGRAFIPANDAEHAIWQYYFELAPYINRTHAPQTPEIYRLIGICEHVLDSLAKQELADKDFREKNQYLIYTMTSFYYIWTHERQYCADLRPWRCSGYDNGFFNDRKQANQLQHIFDTFVKKEEEWKNMPLVIEYAKKKPDFELIHIATAMLLLRDILYYKIQNIEYRCDDYYLDMYYAYADRFYSESSPYHKVEEQLQASFKKVLAYHGVWENFFGHRLCDRKRLPAYSVLSLDSLSRDPFLWDDAFIKLVKIVVPPEKQQDVLERIDISDQEYYKTRRHPWDK